ncbi:MAG: hypothetical protein K0R66_92 [Gammaproteobacteria bacterium]|jgi:hypothetical protein|nr:hypothetical protein [Gammaproteobacteria bacterium]
MKNSLKFLLLGLSVGLASSCWAEGASQTATASAYVLQPVSASIGMSLDFGNISVAYDSGGTIQLNQSSACSVSTTGSVQSAGGAVCGTVNINASPGQAVAISLSNGGNFIVGDGNGNTINGVLETNMSSCYTGEGSPACGTLSIGGTLTLEGTSVNPAGLYQTSSGGGQAVTMYLDYT